MCIKSLSSATEVFSKKWNLRLLAMFSKFSLLAVVLAFGLVSGLSLSLVVKPSKLKLPTNKKILGLQQQTEELAARDPGTSVRCFDYYIPIINGLSAQYELDYNKCVKDYDTASELVLAAWNSTLFGIQASGDRGCNTFFDCSSIVDSVLAFECFANVVSSRKSRKLSASIRPNYSFQ